MFNNRSAITYDVPSPYTSVILKLMFVAQAIAISEAGSAERNLSRVAYLFGCNFQKICRFSSREISFP